ncbi:MAG: hypothetical protein HOI23_20130 [Deltaproteobacteria bacterium]|nr:hypothetical protein [Deltaproteobacteria bacterium]
MPKVPPPIKQPAPAPNSVGDTASPTGCPHLAGAVTQTDPAKNVDSPKRGAVNPFEHSQGIPQEYRERVNADKIPCPALLSLYNNGDLKPESDGSINMEDLDKALGSLGLGPSVRGALVKVADGTDKIPDTFNLFNLRDSNIDHTGSTGIRDPKVDPEKLDTFLSFGTEGRLYASNLAEAMGHFNAIDPGLKGTAIETLEMTALLQVFGREDESRGGDRYFTEQDIKGLWLDGRYPEDWTARPVDDVSLTEVGLVGAKIGISRIWDAITAPIKNFFSSIFS